MNYFAIVVAVASVFVVFGCLAAYVIILITEQREYYEEYEDENLP